jgi:hypothetical protein
LVNVTGRRRPPLLGGTLTTETATLAVDFGLAQRLRELAMMPGVATVAVITSRKLWVDECPRDPPTRRLKVHESADFVWIGRECAVAPLQGIQLEE